VNKPMPLLKKTNERVSWLKNIRQFLTSLHTP
jgi:hypothetical protein